MLQNERFERILQQLHENRTVKVVDLAESLDISESTVRRDIGELAAEGRLRKVFGGAVLVGSDIQTREPDMTSKESHNSQEKDLIAKYAASILEDGDFVFIDAGTTTERIIDYIDNNAIRNITFVTNGISHANKLSHRGCKTYLLGGCLKNWTEAIIGSEAIESLHKYNFTKSFMGTNGVDLNKGFTTPDIDEALVKMEAVKNSNMVYILADHSKFDTITSVTFARIEDASIITDSSISQEYYNRTSVMEAGR